MQLRSPRRGFTLLEVMVAAVLMVIALVGSLALTVGLLRGNQNNRSRDTAYFLAQQALDQYSATPILQLPTLLPGGVAPTDAPICYGMGDDTFIDHPVPCLGNAAFNVRVLACCVGPGMPLSPAPASSCLSLQGETLPATPLPPNVNFTATSQGVSCILQSEVTWPVEPAAATTSGLFVDSSSALSLSFQNHVLLAMVRAQ